MENKEEIVKLARLLQKGELARQRGRLDFCKHDLNVITKLGITRLDAAEFLLENGYGNVKQAVKEFAEKLKEKMFSIDGEFSFEDCWEVVEIDDIDETFKELYGEGEENGE